MGKIIWDNENIELLKEKYPNSSWEELFEVFNTDSIGAIQNKAYRLGIKRNYVWKEEEIKLDNKIRQNFTPEEDKYILDNFNLSAKTVARNLGRSLHSINNRKKKLDTVNRRDWTENELDILKEKYPHYSNVEISKKFLPNRIACVIYKKAKELGLKKSKEKGLKQYNEKEILIKLKELSTKLKRTPSIPELIENNLPSEATYRRYYGSYTNACLLCNLVPNRMLFGKHNCFISSNNDACDSISELIVTEYLIENNINYKKTVKYSDYISKSQASTKTCDWVIENIFVEFFGMMEKPQYKIKTDNKIKILKENNIPLISLFPEDLKNLDKKLNIFKNK